VRFCTVFSIETQDIGTLGVACAARTVVLQVVRMAHATVFRLKGVSVRISYGLI
jgi:hypothetical protein